MSNSISSVILLAACLLPSLSYAADTMDKPGFYPGQSSVIFKYNARDYSAWLEQNGENIRRVQQRIEEIKSDPSNSGCIGRDLTTCLATLSQTLAVANDGMGEDDIFSKPKLDVNGKEIGRGGKSVLAFLPENKSDGSVSDKHIRFDIDLDSSRKIKSISVDLMRKVYFAETQDEYDATGAFQVFKALTANECPDQSAVDVARFIENKIKPTIKHGAKKTTIDWSHASEDSKATSRTVDYCGISVALTLLHGHDTDSISAENTHGAYIFEILTFERAHNLSQAVHVRTASHSAPAMSSKIVSTATQAVSAVSDETPASTITLAKPSVASTVPIAANGQTRFNSSVPNLKNTVHMPADAAFLKAAQVLVAMGAVPAFSDKKSFSIETDPVPVHLTTKQGDCGKKFGIPYIIDSRTKVSATYQAVIKPVDANNSVVSLAVMLDGYMDLNEKALSFMKKPGENHMPLTCSSKGYLEQQFFEKLSGKQD